MLSGTPRYRTSPRPSILPHQRSAAIRPFAFRRRLVLILSENVAATLRGCGMERRQWQFRCVSVRARARWRLPRPRKLRRRLSAAAPDLNVEIVKFETVGDTDQTSKLLMHGGKGGAFVAEIRAAVRVGQVARGDAFAQGHARQRGYAGARDRRDAGARSADRRAGAARRHLLRRHQTRARQGLQNRHQRRAPRRLCAAAVSGHRGDSLSRRRRHACSQARQSRDATLARRRRGRPRRRLDHGALRARTGRARRPHRT